MIQVTASIHYRIIRGKVKYYLHFTFSADAIKALGWKASEPIAFGIIPKSKSVYTSYCVFIRSASAGKSLGRYKNRKALWMQEPISTTKRKTFLSRFSNGIATKIQWKDQGISIVNGVLTLYGKGKPFRKGVNKR